MHKTSIIVNKKDKNDNLEGRSSARESVVAAQFWNTPIKRKFTLLDWLFLLEEEADDLVSPNLCETILNTVSQHCLQNYVEANTARFAVSKTEEDIVQLLLKIKTRPTTLKIQTEEKKNFDFEPMPTEIDTLANGFPISIDDPYFDSTKFQLHQNDAELSPPVQTENEDETNTVASEVDLKKTKKATPNGYRKRKLTGDNHQSTIKKQRNSQGTTPKSTPRQIKQVPKEKKKQKPVASFRDFNVLTASSFSNSFDLPDKEMSIMSEMSVMSSTEEGQDLPELNKKMSKASKSYLRGQSRKVRHEVKQKSAINQDAKTAIPSSIVFEYLEPSSFPSARTKTGYFIKDVDTTKEQSKVVTIKKLPVASKKVEGSVKTAGGSPSVSQAHIYTMPPMAETMTNLGGAVLIKSAHKLAKALGSQASIPDVVEPKPQLKPIAGSKIKAPLTVSELIDRNIQGNLFTR